MFALKRVITRQNLTYFCLLALLANIILVTSLAGAGVLKTTQQGDISYIDTEKRPGPDITLPPDATHQFVTESPTDADAYYDAVVRVWSGGPLYNTWQPDNLQEFHYAPVTFILFSVLSVGGYTVFKMSLFILSLILTVSGTYLLLSVEVTYHNLDLPTKQVWVISGVTTGFSPIVANYKIGQITTFAYFTFCLSWYLYRQHRYLLIGGVLGSIALFKPYYLAPAVALAKSRRQQVRIALGITGGIAIGGVASVLMFGVQTSVQFVQIIRQAVLRDAGTAGGIETWGVETLRVFWFLGSSSTAVRLVSAVPLALVAALPTLYDAEPHTKVSLAVVTLFTLLSSVTFIDAALLTVPLLLLGIQAYATHDLSQLGLVTSSMILIHAHTYVMEAILGKGHLNLLSLVGPSPLLELLQPGVYGILILYAVCLRKLDFVVPGWLQQWNRFQSR